MKFASGLFALSLLLLVFPPCQVEDSSNLKVLLDISSRHCGADIVKINE